MKRIIILVLLLCSALPIYSQTPDLVLDNGVKPHPGIDAIYATFSKAYRDLNVELVANLYTEDANYLAPGAPMTDGRGKIRESFTGFFEQIKKNGQTMEIKFQVLNRDVDQRIGHELGIYTLKILKDGNQIQSGQGKFFVVTKKIGDKWHFRFDGYSDLKPAKEAK